MLISVLCMFSILGLSAQTEVLYGVKGGFNASSVSGLSGLIDASNRSGNSSLDMSVKYRPGFHMGLVSQINITDKFFVQPELLYSLQGFKLSGSGNILYEYVSGSETTIMHYLQLPVYAGTKIAAGQGLDIILGVGPYIAYGLSGEEGTFGDSGMFRRFDFGLTAMGGVQFNKFQITLGYDLGLVDLINTPGWSAAKNEAGISSMCNRNLKASVAYFF